MANVPNSPKFSRFEISRPVIDTDRAREFVVKVNYWGHKIFGDNGKTLIKESYVELDGEEGKPAEAMAALRLVGMPAFEPVRLADLRLPMMERVAPPEANYRGRFAWAVGRLVAREEMRTSQGRTVMNPQHPLHRALELAGFPYDVHNQDDVPVRFAGATLEQPANPNAKWQSLALTPDGSRSAAMLVEQSRLCVQAVYGLSRKAAFPASSYVPHLTIANLPSNVSVQQREDFFEAVRGELPIELHMGPVEFNES